MKTSKACLNLVAAIAAALSAGPASRAEDAVYVRASGGDSAGETKLTGEVLDYTGAQLLLRATAGNQRTIPAARVLRVETTHAAEHATGDKLLAQSQYREALSQYDLAMNKEDRRWVRREILANVVRCHRELRDVSSAVRNFLLIVQSDPATPHFDCVPLAWTNEAQAPQVEDAALLWMEKPARPVESLVGASFLLAGSHRSAALDKLKSLSLDSDERVASLAKAQAWRVLGQTANDRQIEIFSEEIERSPASLRAGAYFVLGRALASRKPFDRAALAYLRVPIVFPRDRGLSALSLLEAARLLETDGQRREAAGLYREIVDGYPQSSVTAEAKSRLAALEKETAK